MKKLPLKNFPFIKFRLKSYVIPFALGLIGGLALFFNGTCFTVCTDVVYEHLSAGFTAMCYIFGWVGGIAGVAGAVMCLVMEDGKLGGLIMGFSALCALLFLVTTTFYALALIGLILLLAGCLLCFIVDDEAVKAANEAARLAAEEEQKAATEENAKKAAMKKAIADKKDEETEPVTKDEE